MADQGRALVIHREEIPGFMGPMVMTLRFWNEQEQARFEDLDVSTGSAVSFELIVADDMYMRQIELLPDDLTLSLPDTGGSF